MSYINTIKTVSVMALAASLSVFSTPAKAQAIDEILVTATKRTESIQDVPVSVSAVSSETITSLGVVDLGELAKFLPNFEINSSTILPNLYVRGLGSGATHSIEQSVGRFVDEVYIGRGAMNIHGFFDIEGVEVLRGPQGTLFGKNTVAGAMIVRTAAPTDEPEMGFNITYGQYSTDGAYQELQGYMSGPFGENLRARLAVRYRTDDGYYINARPELGPSGPERDDVGIRAKFEWDASDSTTVHLKLDHQIIDLFGTDAGEINGGPPPVIATMQRISPSFTPELDWVIDLDCTEVIEGGRNFGAFCPGRDQKTTNVTLRIDHDTAGGTFTSLSAFQTYEFEHKFLGIDGGLANSFRAYRDEDYETFTQELRFTSDLVADKYDYIVGAYYEQSDISRYQTSDVQFISLGLPGGGLAVQRNEPWTQETETYALFGQVRYNLNDVTRLIVGGRWSNETKDFAFDRFYHEYGTDTAYPAGDPLGPFAPPVAVADDRSESKFTPAVTLQYDVNDDVNVYASYAQGHKTGGFSERIEGDASILATPDALDFEFDPEENTTIELGAKGRFLEGRLSANVALFNMDVEGLQLATQLPGTVPAFSVDNAAEVTSQGIELDAVFHANENWTLGIDYAFTDATYDTFDGAEFDPGECPGREVTNPAGGADLCELAGFPLNFAPENKGNAFVEYFNDSGFRGWGAGFGVNVSYSDEYYTDIGYGDSSFEDGYTVWGANARFVSPNGQHTIYLIGKNLTEEEVLEWGIPSGPNSLATLRAPREIAVRLSSRF